MKQVQLFQNCIKVAALFALLMTAYKCAAQNPIRVQTAPGLIEITESGDPDELCIRFGEKAGEVRIDGLKNMRNATSKIGVAALMANKAGVSYSVFLRECGLTDIRAVREYYNRCVSARWQFLALMPERVFLEFQHQIQYF